jgi:hypothetical protein
MIAAAPAMAGMRRAERRVVIIFLSVPRLAVEPLSTRSSFETLSDMRRIPRLFSRRRTPTKPHIELLTLDGVGGRVFTRSIEHTFE